MKVRLRLSLQTKFMVSVMIILVILVMLILFVIEQRERKAIFDEQKSKGVLIAKYISRLNLENFLRWDEEEIKKNIESQIDKNLIYVVFFDRDNKPFVANDFIKGFEQIYMHSSLEGKIKEGSYYFERKRLKDKASGQVFNVLEIEIPVFAAEGELERWGSVKIGHSLKEMIVENQQTRLMMFLIGSVGLIISVGGAILLAQRITGPIKKLVDGTVKIATGDFSQKIDVATQDEIGDLAKSFNEMSRQLLLARKRMEIANRKLIQAEKLASIGRISASIAHEIRNPLTSVKLNIQKVLESDRLDETEKDHLNITQEGIRQIEIFIKELLNFTRVPELNLDKFSIEQIVDESVKMMADTCELKKVRVKKTSQGDLPQLYVDGDRLRQVFLNILHNACEAVDVGGEISISLFHVKDQSGGYMRIEISDNGCGIPEKEWENIFEPFYTTKASGIGLGLANARKIIEQHRGSIRVKRNEEKGSSFEILIPCGGER